MQKEKYIEYKGIKLLEGINTRPHSNLPINTHDEEYEIFTETLKNIKGKENPVMVEIGSWWGFWSLSFRKKFPKGKNYLIELGKRHLCVGLRNFQLNNFSETHYWGGFYLKNSNTAINIKGNYDFDYNENEYFDKSVIGNKVGPELEFIDIYSIEHIDEIDLLHMDIQGSELPIIENLKSEFPWILKDKIKNIIVATHSLEIHNKLEKIFNEFGFNILENRAFGSVGGDGMLIVNK